ncbi:transglutaminase domain-containing protein [uncultured Lacinutrix sp.]|uniref:transglutaminase domain-containing protein n=1 Tax=uncultured Lacinutrix sp. TaxID=574032 RepID=UPI002632F8B8|nr:transglutaminase domain-containing protein [uncultured Lacinutrix sp.]
MKKTFLLFSIFIFGISNAQVSDFNTVDFTIADNTAKLNEGNSLENLPLLAHKLTNKLPTKVEKFRAIYTWVCHNIKGDINQHNKVYRKRKKFKNDSIAYIKWNNEYKKIAFKKLLKHKKTMCTGYAYLIKELCFLANIECKIIDGYGRTVTSNVETLEMTNHSWNVVKLNNKWYLCDATWSSGYMDSNNDFIKDYNEGYFLTDPVLFAKNHFPIDKKWFLNNTLINKKFEPSPIVYNETFKHKVIPVNPKKLNITKTKNEIVNFSFKTLKKIAKDEITLVHFSGNNERRFNIYNLENKNGSIQFKYKFQHYGYYDVHLKVKNDIVATYSIEVTKN